MNFKLVIFDCDGVLVDSEPVSNRLFTDMVNGLGLNLTYSESEKLFTGRSDSDCLKIVESLLGFASPYKFIDDFNLRLIKVLKNELQIVKDIKNVLDYLKDTPVCVASNAPREKVELSLNVTGLRHYFNDCIFSVEDVKKGKPSPDLYLFAAEKMGFQADECAVIEDSVFGVRAGIAAGMTVFGYSERTDETLLKNEGAETFNSMEDLPELLASVC